MTIDLVITDAVALDVLALRALRAGLPATRRARSDRYERSVDRRASVLVFAQLQHLWRERREGMLPPISTGEFGKPDFGSEVGLHFNCSHDGALCACVLASVPVGVDISGRVPFDGDLFRYMAAPGELRLGEILRRRDDMSPLWTRKEASVKRTGLGLTAQLQELDTTSSRDLLTFASEAAGFTVSLSAAGLPEQQLRQQLRIRFLTPQAEGRWIAGPAPPLRRLGPMLN